MDRSEAIKVLFDLSDQCSQQANIFCTTDADKRCEAIDMAIEALEDKGLFDQYKWERDVAMETLEEHGLVLGQKKMDESEDLISRSDAIDALGEEPEIWNDTEEEWAYRNAWVEHISAIKSLPSAEPKTDEENELKFYYVESIDDYWIGQRLDNFYYANWHEGLGFIWSHSRYLPWGEHIVDENTLWKEHTYPSGPIEIPFTEWIVGFVKKYFAEPKTETVLCALADRTCPFLGKEFAWCLTCPHISEEDRDLVKKAISEPKTGKCEQCTYWDKLDYEAPRQGWCNQFEEWTDADEYCSRCAKMRGEEE